MVRRGSARQAWARQGVLGLLLLGVTRLQDAIKFIVTRDLWIKVLLELGGRMGRGKRGGVAISLYRHYSVVGEVIVLSAAGTEPLVDVRRDGAAVNAASQRFQ